MFSVSENSQGFDLRYELVNPAAVALAGVAASYVPAISGKLSFTFLAGGVVGVNPSGDPYPSLEIYQRRPDGGIVTRLQITESSSGPLCLIPGFPSC